MFLRVQRGHHHALVIAQNNHELQRLCVRIQARAVRRCGELLQEFQQPKGGNPVNIKVPAPIP
jgi:hypothetical protein